MGRTKRKPYISRFLNEEYQRRGEGFVPCQITERWLQFDKHCEPDLDYIRVDVMTRDAEGQAKKLCNLCIRMQDVACAIENAKSHS